MKKIFWLIFLILILSSCWEEPCKTVECVEAQMKMQEFQEQKRVDQEKKDEVALEKKRLYELEKLKIEASKPVATKRLENQEAWNESLEYLENSQKARDVIEWAAIWYGIFKILVD